jgi:adenylate cyclase
MLGTTLATEPNRLGEDFGNELIKHTGGHALFTVELLRTMQERGDLVQDGHGAWTEGPVVDWGTLPARIEAVIEERIARLSPELRDILTVASVEGEVFTAQVVARIQETDDRDVLRVLSLELEKRHRLVREQGGLTVDGKRLSRYRFAHALFQEYLHRSLSEGERALLHWEVGAALEALHAGQTDEIAVELSHHYAVAEDSERERHYARLAGERAAAKYAHDEAGRYLSRALDLTPETNYDERFALLLAREEVYSFQGDRESQAAGLAALDQLIEALDTDEPAAAKRAEIALRHAKYAEATHDLSAGIKASRMAIDYARTAQDVRAEAEGYFLWGLLLDKNGDMAAARPKFEQGLALAQAADARMIEASCVRALGWICCDQGDFDESEAYLSKSLSISREIGDLLGEARALHHLGSTLSLKYGVTAATDYFQQAIMICRKIGHRSGEADTLATDGWQSLYMGDSARSEASFQAALKILHEAGKPDLQANVLGGLGRLYREYVGDFERARACGEEALRLAQEVGSLFNEAIGELNIGFALHYQGDYSGAELHMQRFLGIMCGNRGWLGHGALGRVGVGLNAIAMGEYSAALAHLERARSTFRELRLDITDDDAWAQSALALLYHQLGEDQTAREYATRALTIHRNSGYDYRTATALTRLGHALTALRELAEAAAAYQEALDLRRQMGQRHLAPEPLAGLARVALAQGGLAQAGTYVDEILAHLETGAPGSGHPLDGTDEPICIYLTCYRVLRANSDPRAKQVLEEAHSLLQERAAEIDDDDLRHSYLENVTANRELVAEWKDLSDCRHAAAV